MTADRAWAVELIEHPALAEQPRRLRAALELAARAPEMSVGEVVDWVGRHIPIEPVASIEDHDREANVIDFLKAKQERTER